jgi:hypothetical protein
MMLWWRYGVDAVVVRWFLAVVRWLCGGGDGDGEMVCGVDRVALK